MLDFGPLNRIDLAPFVLRILKTSTGDEDE